MTLAEFHDELVAHDWFFAMTDDPKVYRKGREDYQRLRILAIELGDDAQGMFRQFNDHYRDIVSGAEKPTPIPPKPTKA